MDRLVEKQSANHYGSVSCPECEGLSSPVDPMWTFNCRFHLAEHACCFLILSMVASVEYERLIWRRRWNGDVRGRVVCTAKR